MVQTYGFIGTIRMAKILRVDVSLWCMIDSLMFADKESNLQTTITRGKSHGEVDVLHHACPRTRSLQKVREKPLALWPSSITEYLPDLPLT